MSLAATRLVWDQSRATGSARLVLLYLADCANDSMRCWPSIDRIAEKTAVSRRQVQRAVTQLEELRELRIVEKGDGRGNSTVYELLLKGDICDTKGDTVTPFSETEKGDICDTKGDILSQKGDILSIKGDTMSPDPIRSVNDPSQNRKGDRAQARAEPTPRQRQVAAMINILAEITAMDGHLNFRPLEALAEQLLEAYTADQVRAYYAAGQSPNGHWNWYLHDWRGQKGERPSLKAVRETIKAAVAGPPSVARDVPAPVAPGQQPRAIAALEAYERRKQEFFGNE